MNKFIIFTKKELFEQIRTYKTLIFFCVFLIIGMLSPLTAKLAPELIKNLNTGGIIIEMPSPTVQDAYFQFFKNTTQIGFVVILLVFGGIISNEISKGTLVNLISKGLSRNTVILSKLFSSVILWTISFLVSIVTNLGYTLFLFGKHDYSKVFLPCFCIWVFGIFLLTLIIFSSTLVRENFGGLLLSVFILGILFILDIFPKIKKFSPLSLVTDNSAMMTSQIIDNITISIISTIILGCILVFLSINIFKKKQI